MTKPNTSPVPSPKGTRDLYPDHMARQNYITRLWRDTAIRHGFEEINGPTFEMLELYTRKSGEGIVSELFRFRREGGEDDYALRPEFTPTLARMYAAKAASLPSPTKWFSIGPYFRAEKPQRGRLREFLQWNVDVLGEESLRGDSEVLQLLVGSLLESGIRAENTQIKISDRTIIEARAKAAGVKSEQFSSLFWLFDNFAKLSKERILQEMEQRQLDRDIILRFYNQLMEVDRRNTANEPLMETLSFMGLSEAHFTPLSNLMNAVSANNNTGWLKFDPTIVRGLAYYTGTVFEVIAEGERAIAGGGRYDNLIELFGGPPTPAVGFGMGDVVLGLLLEDKGLMPQGAELLDALSRPGASLRPEAFVVADKEQGHLIEPLLANLRRGIERDGFDGKPWAADRYAVRPLHARRTYKTTSKFSKLLNDAEKQHARYVVVVHDEHKVQLKDLDRREELPEDFSVDPKSEAYVGKAIAQRLA